MIRENSAVIEIVVGRGCARALNAVIKCVVGADLCATYVFYVAVENKSR